MMLEELCSFVRSTVSAPRMHLLILAPWKKNRIRQELTFEKGFEGLVGAGYAKKYTHIA